MSTQQDTLKPKIEPAGLFYMVFYRDKKGGGADFSRWGVQNSSPPPLSTYDLNVLSSRSARYYSGFQSQSISPNTMFFSAGVNTSHQKTFNK